MKETLICDECGSDMVLRKSQHGEFYGCSKYPECKHTAKVGKSDEKGAKPQFKPTTKEFHLTPEQVRTNAFDLALRSSDEKPGSVEFFKYVKAVENYLWNGE